jgi:S-adenosylmethionine-diacylgycerolhomoserine-N-methlytransferase
MDSVYRVQRHFYDLTRKYYLLGRDALIDSLHPPLHGCVLEIGCGTGRNLIRAARAWPQAHFYGLDISQAMLDTAATNIARAGLGDRITLARADAARFDAAVLFGQPAFDRVFMSYTLSMIPDWQGAIREAAGKLRAGGELHIVDFGQQEGLPGWWKRGLFAWLARFHVTPRASLPGLLHTLMHDEGYQAAFRSLHRGYAWSARLTSP